MTLLKKYLDTKWDVIVIGGGHAGCEAACAAARLHINTLLVTRSLNDIGLLACNPSIGGIGKGHLVKEIDALDGVMGSIADKSSIHSRMLNTKKGPAVQALRLQSDRYLYQKSMYDLVSNYPFLSIAEASVQELIVENSRIQGIKINNNILYAKSVVLTSGTSMESFILRGETREKCLKKENQGNILSKQLQDFGCEVLRFKTGTPPRIKSSTIDWNSVGKQYSDEEAPFFSHTETCYRHHIACGITYTQPSTHDIIRNNINLSANFNGSIYGVGPRYCPSIEDKIHRFSHNNHHHVFLEPEGLYNNLVYPNGISNALPPDIQEDFIHSIPGLENAHIAQYGYSIEYDCFSPLNLTNTLEVKSVSGLFLAGQINGTTGYEEAAAQGIIAGINGALLLRNKRFILNRDTSYIGVLIDDLVTKGVTEPYRMFTSRSELRLYLRFDNADLRITPLGEKIGVISKKRKEIFNNKIFIYKKAREDMNNIIISSKDQSNYIQEKANLDGEKKSLFSLLYHDSLTYDFCCKKWDNISLCTKDIFILIKNDSLYSPYIERERNSSLIKKSINIQIPKDLDYNSIHGLSKESRETLTKLCPKRIQDLLQIEGITAATITCIIYFLRKNKNKT